MSTLFFSQAHELARLATERAGLLEDYIREHSKPSSLLAVCVASVRIDVVHALGEADRLRKQMDDVPRLAPECTGQLRQVLHQLAKNVDLLDTLLCTVTRDRVCAGPPLTERFPAPAEAARDARASPVPAHEVILFPPRQTRAIDGVGDEASVSTLSALLT